MQTSNLKNSPALLYAFVAAISIGTVAQASPLCERVTLDPRPGWLTSAVWAPSPSGGSILAVDSTAQPAGRLMSIAPNGKGNLLPQSAGKVPVIVAQSPLGPILKLLGADVMTLEGVTPAAADFLHSATAPEGKVGSIYQWVGMGDAMLAFGSLRNPTYPRGYQLGFLRIPISGAQQPTSLLAAPLKGDYYSLGPPYQYLAALGSSGYYLRMESEGTAEIFEVPSGARQAKPFPIEGIPEKFLQVPEFSSAISGPAQAPALYEQLEGLTLAAGLYGSPDGKQLYLLTRRPSARNQTEWLLLRIDPAQRKVVGSFVLPTTAPEVILVFSPTTLFVIERHDLNAGGVAVISEMVKVPMSVVAGTENAGSASCRPQ